MLTENYIDDKITFPKGQFLAIRDALSIQHGQKDVDWFNLFCGKDNENESMETMHFRHRAEIQSIDDKMFGHHDALDYVIDNDKKVGDFLEMYGHKSQYKGSDLNWFVNNSY